MPLPICMECISTFMQLLIFIKSLKDIVWASSLFLLYICIYIELGILVHLYYALSSEVHCKKSTRQALNTVGQMMLGWMG